jgi:hypothetical protein
MSTGTQLQCLTAVMPTQGRWRGDLATAPSCSDADKRVAPTSGYKTSLHHS